MSADNTRTTTAETVQRGWVLSLDTLVEGTHFLASAGLDAIAHKALAVNLSDMAAMGASPVHINTVIVCADAERATRIGSLLREKCRAMAGIGPQSCNIVLVNGPGLNVSVEVIGALEHGGALLRSGARDGDLVYVSGTLGDAGAGLVMQTEQRRREMRSTGRPQRAVPAPAQWLLNRLHRPTPRLALGQALVGLASACIDVSDGLLSDLGHLCKASQVNARIRSKSLPLSEALRSTLSSQQAIAMALSGGDDYELCFTAPSALAPAIRDAARGANCPICCIGNIIAGNGQLLLDDLVTDARQRGFDHFAGPAEARQHGATLPATCTREYLSVESTAAFPNMSVRPVFAALAKPP